MAIEIKSRPYPTAKRTGESINGMLEDIDGYKPKTLAEFRRFAFWFSQLQRFSREENQLLCGHVDWLLKQKLAEAKDNS
jgi:hypothetical protein